MPSLEFLDLEGLKDRWARWSPPGGWLKAGVLRGPGGGQSGGCPHPSAPTLSSLPAPPRPPGSSLTGSACLGWLRLRVTAWLRALC